MGWNKKYFLIRSLFGGAFGAFIHIISRTNDHYFSVYLCTEMITVHVPLRGNSNVVDLVDNHECLENSDFALKIVRFMKKKDIFYQMSSKKLKP